MNHVIITITGAKVRSFSSLVQKIKVVSEETTFYFDVSQKHDYNFGPAATKALPASFPSYFLKFLMKRPARSSAFLFHSAASA